MTGRLARIALLVLIGLVPGSAVHAQSNVVRIIFPFAAGGSGDATARLLADKLQSSLGRTVLVEDRTGGAGDGVVLARRSQELAIRRKSEPPYLFGMPPQAAERFSRAWVP